MGRNGGSMSPGGEFEWRKSAPNARRAAVVLYSWLSQPTAFLWALAGAIPFLLMTALSPAMLSLSPTVEMIAPIADARAIANGAASVKESASPLYMALLLAGDFVSDTPGRVHLVAKALGAVLVLVPFAYFASSRFPAFVSAFFAAGLAAYVAAPYSGPAELGLALLLVAAVVFVSSSADLSIRSAALEGAVAGGVVFMLWMLSPVLAFAAFLFLSACPFFSGKSGLPRYSVTLVFFAILAGILELVVPGINVARATAATGAIDPGALLSGQEGVLGVSGVSFSAAAIIAAAAIFGGREHVRSWAAGIGVAVLAFIAARFVGANAIPVFALAAGIACFSTASPFYDGIFRNHDRASISIALLAASLTLFWTGVSITHSFAQFSIQHQLAKAAPENVRAELALVQPGGLTIARWVEEGRFSTPEARELFALAPVDQSTMLLEAAKRARTLNSKGLDVAILTGSDTACVLTAQRDCHADGPAAANAAAVVFVPRLDLDPHTASAKGRSEALLYTEFKMVERTPLWEVWVRRGASMPANFSVSSAAAAYR